MCNNIVSSALEFATLCHKGQKRKYNGLPYISHPIAVSDLVARHIYLPYGKQHELMAIALLHDVVEDCGVTIGTIYKKFGQYVGDGVNWLTDAKDMTLNRKARHQLTLERLELMPYEIKEVKCLDRYHNLTDMETSVEAMGFLRSKYLSESKDVLEALRETADSAAWNLLRERIKYLGRICYNT